MVVDIRDFYRMSPSARITVVLAYNDGAVRNRNGNYELIVRNWAKKQIWLPLDYCMKGKFSNDDHEKIRSKIQGS